MKKLTLLLFLVGVFCIHEAAAKPVKEDEAKQFAKNWAREKWGKKIDSVSTKEKAKASVQQINSEENLYYVLSFPQGGWMIISGDDVAYPVIAYSKTGAYSGQNRPEQFNGWMEYVKKDISSAIVAKHTPLPKTTAAWKKFNVSAEEFAAKSSFAPAEASSVEAASAGPLLSTEWDQGTYYNEDCPDDAAGPDGHVWAGCVATAMAQIMKYHSYPTTGTGSHSYSHPVYGTQSANFGSATYNWASMPNSLSDYNSDVAKLLYHAGVSVDMDYAPDGSGAYMSDAAYALKTYFKYSDSLGYIWKSSYSTDEWTAILRTEIDNKRPILYSGHGTGGHAFVCDGYSGSDYFHFNWGWSGQDDSYFYLNDLTPGSHDYTSSQGAVIGIRPPLPPVGSFDSADCSSLSGWAKDPDTTAPISVHFYKDGPAGTGTYLGNATADIYRGDLPYTDKDHGFSLSLPDSLNDGAAHQIYAYAIDDAGGINPLLTNSPKTVQCGLTSDQLAAVMSVINEILMEDVDSDGDGILDSKDNCPSVSNADQKNTDGDSSGDACDSDDDNDGVPDISDAFPLNPNEWADTDGDGIGNNADPDDDNDGVADEQDAFPLDPSESKDADGDGIGDNADPDDDNDGIPDELENLGKALPAIIKMLLK